MADNDVVTPETPEADAAITPETPAVLGTRDIVTALVKDDDDGARAAFHQVLQGKMRDRINPPDADEGGTEDGVTDEDEPKDDE